MATSVQNNGLRQRGADPRLALACWLALALLFIAQYVFFKNFILTEISPYFPDNHDQVRYLLESYEHYDEVINAEGAGERLSLLFDKFLEPSPQGRLFVVLAEAVFLAAGPSRLHALLLNFFFFLGLQAAVFFTVKNASGRYSAAFMAEAVLLALAYTFYSVGDISDFRLDFAAFCAYGIFAAIALRSGAFLSRRWSLVATVAAAFVVLLRHLTITYIGTLYLLTLIMVVAVFLSTKDGDARQKAAARMKNIVLSGVGVLVLISANFIKSWEIIYNYYWAWTISGKNQYFKPQEGADHLKYFYDYCALAWNVYFGKVALCLCAAAIIFALALFLIGHFTAGKRPSPRTDGMLDKETFLFLFLAAGIPLFILSMGMNFNPVVASIMVAPIVLFIMTALSLAIKHAEESGVKRLSIALPVIAVLMTALAMKYHLASYTKQSPVHARHNAADITRMYLEIANYAVSMGLKKPALSVDRISTALTSPTATIMYYEKTGLILPFSILTGDGVAPITLDKAVEGVRKSDFVIFSEYPAGPNWPLDISLNEYRPILAEVLAKEFKVIGEYEFDNSPFRVYVNPAVGKD